MKTSSFLLFASVFASVFVGALPHANAAVLTGTMVNGFFTVNSPWSQTVSVSVRIGRVREANGTLGKTTICYENLNTGSVATIEPPQSSNGTLTEQVRLNGSADDDFFTLWTLTSLPDVTDFCLGFPGRKLVMAPQGGKLIYVDARGGHDQVFGGVEKLDTHLGEGNDLVWVNASSVLRVNSDDRDRGIDNVYSLNAAFHGESWIVGAHARDCMTDFSGTLNTLFGGGSDDRVFVTTPLTQSQLGGRTEVTITIPSTILGYDPRTDFLGMYCHEFPETSR